MIFRLTNVNDLVIDFRTGEQIEYQFRAKGSPVSVAPPENLFLPQIANAAATCPSADAVAQQLNAIAQIRDPNITPGPGGTYIPLSATINAARSHPEVTAVESEYGNSACESVFAPYANNTVMQWIARLDAQQGTASKSPAHSIDFTVNLEPNQNYEFTIQTSWKGAPIKGGTINWNCGESDILTLSAGPLITTLPYRSYNQQQVPVSTGGTQNQLVVSGTGNVNVLGAALLNYHFPQIPHVPAWTGLALSVGPVYTLNSTPSVSKLGLFVGGSIQLYRSVFLSPGIHIGQFADFPAGFHSGSVIPPNFGGLTPVTRNTVHFAAGITFKTVSFKKSSQNNGTAKNTAAPGGTAKPAPQQSTGNKGAAPNPTPTPQQP